MKTSLLLLIAISIFNCSSNQESNIEIKGLKENIAMDSVTLNKWFKDTSQPNLISEEIETLFSSLPDTNKIFWLFENLTRLDSIKKADQYEIYLSKLDIGMIKQVVSKKFKTIELDEGVTLVLWGLDFQSYEACPFTEGKVMFISTIKNGQNLSSVPAAYSQQWADAPFYNNIEASFTLNTKGQLKIIENQVEGEIDDNGKEIESKRKNIMVYFFKNGGFS